MNAEINTDIRAKPDAETEAEMDFTLPKKSTLPNGR